MSDYNVQKLKATGIVLAGGKNSRMKKNKAFLELNGRPLVERSLEVLLNTFDEVIISSNQPELYEKYSVRVVSDVIKDKGPIGGLYSCLMEAKYDICFFVACDMPFINEELIRYLAQSTQDFEVVVPELISGLNPLHAFYNRSCLPIIEKNLKTECLKIIDFYPKCSIQYIKEAQLKVFGDLSKIFSNINTPEEWVELNETYSG